MSLEKKYKILVISQDAKGVGGGTAIHSVVLEYTFKEDANEAGRCIVNQMDECAKSRKGFSLVKEIVKLY